MILVILGNMTAEQKSFNDTMASVRICVEWEFGHLIQKFSFLDFKQPQRIMLSPIAKYFMVSALIKNCHVCLNGSQTSAYFDFDPPSLAEYLA